MKSLFVLRVRKRWILVALTALLLLLAAAGVSLWQAFVQANSDRYACDDAGILLADYMATHSSEWPHGWEDLEAYYPKFQERWTRARAFSDLRQRVEIDFSADVVKMQKEIHDNKDLHLRVLWPRRRWDPCGGVKMGNGNVEDYFRNPDKYKGEI